jgi:hypothetical protein
MTTVNRRAFLATAAVGLCTMQRTSPAHELQQQIYGSEVPQSLRLAFANALNFSSFVQNKEHFALSAVMATRPVISKVGSYPAGSLFLFPFSSRNSQASGVAAFLPGSAADSSVTATAPMATLGLPPDEFFCHYVIQVPSQSFISCEVGARIAHDDARGPWHGNVVIAGATLGFRWASSNLNGPWFGGSRWIPESGEGDRWRNHFIEGVRNAAALAHRTGSGDLSS